MLFFVTLKGVILSLKPASHHTLAGFAVAG
jgi:hypothetical protein